LPETYPGIRFDEDGICNVCRHVERKWGNKNWGESRAELERIFESYKGAGKYDCVVPLSGGKDSTYSLYVCSKVYKLRVLAVNFDNGFQTEQGRQNIENTIVRLGVDYKCFKPRWDLMQRIYSCFLRKIGEVCLPCNIGLNATIYKVAEEEKIALIVYGYSPKLELSPIYGGERYCREELFKEVSKDEIAPEEMESFLIKPITEKTFFQPINLPYYIDWNEEKILKTLEGELGWSKALHGKAKADCSVFPIANYLKRKETGFGRLTLRNSALIRDGQRSREDALRNMIFDEPDEEPAAMNLFLEQLNLTKDAVEGFERKNRLGFVKGPRITVSEIISFALEEKTDIERIRRAIEMMRPTLQRDGGDLELVEVLGGIVRVCLKGACRGCPMSQMVMLNYIEGIFMELCPQVGEVKVIN